MKTTLLIMAAGIGSRFGTGIKQLEPVDASNHIIMDYSIHDAIEAGFNHMVIIPGLSEPPVRRMRAIYSGNSEPPYWALLHIFPLYCKDTPLV